MGFFFSSKSGPPKDFVSDNMRSKRDLGPTFKNTFAEPSPRLFILVTVVRSTKQSKA